MYKMKYLKKFKLFENLDEDQVKTLEEIFLDVTDLGGWSVIISKPTTERCKGESIFDIVIC